MLTVQSGPQQDCGFDIQLGVLPSFGTVKADPPSLRGTPIHLNVARCADCVCPVALLPVAQREAAISKHAAGR